MTFSYVFVKELMEKMDPRLISYYKENNGKNKYFKRPLQDIIKEIVDTQLASGQVSKQQEKDSNISENAENMPDNIPENINAVRLRELKERKARVLWAKKKRFLKKCQDMRDSNEKNGDSDKYFLQQTLMLYRLTPEAARQITFDGKNFEEIEEEKLAEIEKWASNNKSRMVDYPGEEKQTANAAIKNFELDVVIDILNIISREYDYDLNRATYAVIDNLKNQPLFSPVSSKVAMASLSDGQNGCKELSICKTPDGSRKLVIEIPAESFDKQGNFRIMDDVDKEILSYLILVWNDKSPNMKFAAVKVSDVIRAVYGKNVQVRENKRTDIIKRISRMYEFGLKDVDDGKISGRNRIISGFRQTQDGKYIHYSIDPFYLDDYNSVRVRKMSSAPLGMLKTKTARILYAAFMEQRRIAYKQSLERETEPKNYVMPLEYNYFMYWCNFNGMTKKKMEEKILEALEDFKENRIMVQDYRNMPSKQLVYVYFDVLSEEEIKDYDFYYDIHQIPQKEDELDAEQINMFFPVIEN